MCAVALSSFLLCAMDYQEPDSVCAALIAQFEEIRDSRMIDNAGRLEHILELQDQLLAYGILTEQSLQQIIQSLTSAPAGVIAAEQSPAELSPVDEVARRLKIEGDRQILDKQQRGYEESLRIDQEKARREEAVQVLQDTIRAYNVRINFKKALDQLREKRAWVQNEFESMCLLDECIAKLAKAENPKLAYNRVSAPLGENMGLLQLLRRHGFSIATALQEENRQEYKTENERQRALCAAVAQLLECDETLAQCRAQRIVQNFLGHDLKPDGGVELVPVEKVELVESATAGQTDAEPEVASPDLHQPERLQHVETEPAKQQQAEEKAKSWGQWFRSTTGIGVVVTAVLTGAVVCAMVIKHLKK